MNINPFKSDAARKFVGDLDHARAAHTKLAERLSAAETAVAERRAVTQSLTRNGADDAALDIAEAALRAAQDRAVTLIGALGEAETQVARLEREQAQFADHKLRVETAAAVDKLADEIEKAGAAFEAGAAQLAGTSQRVAAIILDGHGLQAFAQNAGREVPAAVAMIAGLLRDRARATIAGTAPAALPKPDQAREPVQLPAPRRPSAYGFFAMPSFQMPADYI